MKQILQFLSDCRSSIRPAVNLIRLPIARFKLRTVNPLCPAEQMRELVLRVNKLERS